MFVFAHQDDELPYAGLVQRAPEGSRFLWLTNGDGLAEEAGVGLDEYAATRRLETTEAMSALGIPEDHLRFLGHSEVEIYRNLTKLASKTGRKHDVLESFRAMGAQVTAELLSFGPDDVFTLAWQGGHPEHDLAHMMTRAALKDMNDARLFELPEYELANTVLLRFPPWRSEPVHEIVLDEREMTLKREIQDLYHTQESGIRAIRTAVKVMGVVGRLIGKYKDADDYVAKETFGPVPDKRDYCRSPHGLDALEYIGDDFEGTPIKYSTMLAPLADMLD